MIVNICYQNDCGANGGQYAKDDNMSTAWNSNSNGLNNWWIKSDLGSNKAFDKVGVHSLRVNASEAYIPVDFTVQVSTNNSSYTTVATVTGNAATDRDVTFTQTTARYVRLNIKRVTYNYRPVIKEFRVFGVGSDIPPYILSGTSTSPVKQLPIPHTLGIMSWVRTLNSQPEIGMQVQTCASSTDCTNTPNWKTLSPSCGGSDCSINLAGVAGLDNNHQYIQYRATLQSSDGTATPSLDSVNIGVSYVPMTIKARSCDDALCAGETAKGDFS